MPVPDYIYIASYIPATCQTYKESGLNLVRNECGMNPGSFSSFSTLPMLDCFFKTCLKTTVSFLGPSQLRNSQISGSFPGFLSEFNYFTIVQSMVHFQDPCQTSQLLWRWQGLDPKVLCPDKLFPIWTFSPFYGMDMESRLHDTEDYGLLKCDAA